MNRLSLLAVVEEVYRDVIPGWGLECITDPKTGVHSIIASRWCARRLQFAVEKVTPGQLRRGPSDIEPIILRLYRNCTSPMWALDTVGLPAATAEEYLR